MKVYLTSLGCKLNQSEIENLTRQFLAAGYLVVADPAQADLLILNTCAVTGTAAQKSRQALHHLRRSNPASRLVATGCYAELAPVELSADLVVGNPDKDRLVEIVEGIRDEGQRISGKEQEKRVGIVDVNFSVPIPGRTRAFVKIQDGCDNACTYCVVRIARGRQRSRPLEEVVKEVTARTAAGYKEVVLTGVHIGAYGRDLGTDLPTLVRTLLEKTTIPRLRLSSIEPWDLNPAFLELWADPRLCRHLHLPLQSGCDRILRLMNRHYTTADFARLVEMARQRISDLAVTTDIIVGFPGESEADHQISLRFVEEMAFARLHVFRYSARPGTPAAAMPAQVPEPIKQERSAEMQAIGREASQAFYFRFVNRTLTVLWENQVTREGKRLWSGLTDNYLRVEAAGPSWWHNTLLPVHLRGVRNGPPLAMLGEAATDLTSA